MAKQAIDKQAGNKAMRLMRSYKNEGFVLLASIKEEVKGKISPEILPEVESPATRRRGANRRVTDATATAARASVDFYNVATTDTGADLSAENSIWHAMTTGS